jgi:hypothetical protein
VLVCDHGLIVPVQNLIAIASPSMTPMPDRPLEAVRELDRQRTRDLDELRDPG